MENDKDEERDANHSMEYVVSPVHKENKKDSPKEEEDDDEDVYQLSQTPSPVDMLEDAPIMQSI